MAWLEPSAASKDTVQVATSPVSVTESHPMELPSLVKSTVPVGLPEAGETGETVAVKVTDWPVLDGLVPLVRVVTVPVSPGFTVWVMVSLEPLKLSSPE